MTLLNKRHNYGLELFLLSIDEGITGQFKTCLSCMCLVQSKSTSALNWTTLYSCPNTWNNHTCLAALAESSASCVAVS